MELAATDDVALAVGASSTSVARRVVTRALVAYLLARLVLLITAMIAAGVHGISLETMLTPWDATYYSSIAQNGYPTSYVSGASSLAFFPLYPLLGWLVAVVTRLPIPWVLIVLSWVGGAVATGLAGLLALRHFDERRALQAAVLFAVFPGSVIAGFPYAESMGISFGIGAVIALEQRRWLLAGILGALTTATLSPLLAPLLVFEALTFLKDRQRGALLALVLTPVGELGYFAFLWGWTGSPLTWYDVEKTGWLVRLTLPTAHLTSYTDDAFSTPGASLVTCCTIAVALLCLFAVWRMHAPITWGAFSLVIFLAVTFDGGNWIEPRFLWDAFPGVLALGALVPPRAFRYVATASLVALVLLLLAYSPVNYVFWNP